MDSGKECPPVGHYACCNCLGSQTTLTVGLCLATNRTTASFESEAGPHVTNSVFKWDCAQVIQFSSVFGVELATSKVY